MARKVKCAITGEYGTSDSFIKIDKRYYKSQEIYESDRKKKDLYKQIKDIICYDILDYQKGQSFPTELSKKLKELKFYDNEVILKTIQDFKNDIVFWLNKKNIETEHGKIAYIFAIINNHINDVYKQWKRDKQQTIKEEKSEIETSTDISNLGAKVKAKDISAWLEDD